MVSARLSLVLRITWWICRLRLSLLRTLLWTSSKKSGCNPFPDAGNREFSASHNQSTSSSTAEPLSNGREIHTITSRKTMIHDPDTSTFNSVDIYDELRRAYNDKGLWLAPSPSEFVDRNICRRTREYVWYVYYTRTRRYIHIRTTSVPIIDYACSHLCVRT